MTLYEMSNIRRCNEALYIAEGEEVSLYTMNQIKVVFLINVFREF